MSHLESMSAQAKVSYHRMMAQKNHQMHMNKHMQTCRIECACGCHHQLDSLPHLLSPYIVTQAQVLLEINTLNISKAYRTSVFQYTIKVAVPPPNLS